MYGIHIDNIQDIISISKQYKNINLIQTFLSATTDYTTNKYTNVIKCIQNNNISIVVHSSYSINLSKEWYTHSWWINQLIGEIEKAVFFDAIAFVVHTGKKLELPISVAINNMYSSLLYVHYKTKKYKIKILIETPAGQGTEILTNITDFCYFMNKFYKHPDDIIQNRFGICVDTCHIFASGYDIRTKHNIYNFFNIINNIIGINKILLCHLNDSKQNINKKLDRHANIGYGYIGIQPIKLIVNFLQQHNIHIILETPYKYIDRDYKMLQSFLI